MLICPVFYEMPKEENENEEKIMYIFTICMFVLSVILPYYDKELIIFLPLATLMLILSEELKTKKEKEIEAKRLAEQEKLSENN